MNGEATINSTLRVIPPKNVKSADKGGQIIELNYQPVWQLGFADKNYSITYIEHKSRITTCVRFPSDYH
jgi:hypothetical protein